MLGMATYRPKPFRMAFESLPMMLVLLPTRTCLADFSMGPSTKTTLASLPLTAEVKAAYEETVVVVPPAPPLVPPFSLA
jgi:hypothetical protein